MAGRSPNRDNSIWVDVAAMEYPRMLYKEDAEQLKEGFHVNKTTWAFDCVHGRDLETRCVSCEGLSILMGTRR